MKLIRYICSMVLLLGFTLLPGKVYASEVPSPEIQLLFYSAEGPAHFLVVEKKQQKIKLFEQGDSLKMIKEFTCATGEKPGTKKTSGDSRTPEGIYHITEVYEDKRITVFGSRAFHLDYPNVFDSHAGRLGDGIFIHGTNKKLIPNSTNGCITLNNADLDELAPFLAVQALPIIVLDSQSEFAPADSLALQKDHPAFHHAIDQLAFDREKNSLDNLRSLSYLRRGEQVIITAHYKIFEDTFTQYYENKRAYLIRVPSGNWRTLHAVQSQNTPPTILALQPSKTALVTKSQNPVEKEAVVDTQAPPSISGNGSVAAKDILPGKAENLGKQAVRTSTTKPLFDKNQELLAFIEKWRSAWAEKDIETYMNCYSPSFKNGKLDRDDWRARKTYLNNKYKFIKVTVRNIVVEWTANGAEVTFQQTYTSDQLQNSGTKTLHLINKKNRWMIEKELI